MSEDKWDYLNTLTREELTLALRIEAGDESALPEGWEQDYEDVRCTFPELPEHFWPPELVTTASHWRVEVCYVDDRPDIYLEGECCCTYEGIKKAEEAYKEAVKDEQ